MTRWKTISVIIFTVLSMTAAPASAGAQTKKVPDVLSKTASIMSGHALKEHSSPQGRSLVSPAIFAKALKVHRCEYPFNWHGNSTYPDGIGMTLANWLQFRAPSFPANPQKATPQEQAWVLSHFLGHYHMAWPHQNYPMSCGKGY